MIALRTSGSDNNPAGASAFCGIPVPVGVVDGDLIIVGIALPAAGVTVTPPSADWVQVAQTDKSVSTGITAFYKTAMNEPARWIFALSSSVQSVGAAMVYANADAFQPVEAYAAALTAATPHAVAAVTTSLDQEELVLFLGANAAGTYTIASGWLQSIAKSQTAAAISAQRRQVPTAGVTATFTEAFSVAAAGASLVLALRPSAGLRSYQDTYDRVVEALPPGIDKILDFTPNSGDFWKFFWVIGSVLKVYCFDLIDLMRLEVVPNLSRYKLPDWERVFGLETTLTAKLGTIPQRQQQITSAWRAAAGQGSSIPEVQGVLAPLLGYSLSNNVVVVECDRDVLTAAHTYAGGAVTVANNGTATKTATVSDSTEVAAMGAQLFLNLTHPDPSKLAFTLTGPDGTSKSWSAGYLSSAATTPTLFAIEFAEKVVGGTWTLQVTDVAGGGGTLTWGVFVEGIGRDARGMDGLGAAIFDWGVYADPAHLGESGTAANFTAARAALHLLAQAHTVVNLIQSLAPYPDVDSGLHAAIPDECIPT